MDSNNPPTATVKEKDFKKCHQSGFCQRNRALADEVSGHESWSSPYELDPSTITFKNGQLEGIIVKTTSDIEKVRLPLTVSFLHSGLARVTVDEEKRMNGDIELRHGSKVRKQRYNEAGKWALVGGLELSKTATLNPDTEPGTTKVLYGPDDTCQAVIRHAPFGVAFQKDGRTHVEFNKRGYMNVEQWRPEVDLPEDDRSQDNWWDESFGGNTDSKPRGPESVGLDISFPGYANVFGIPEHADSLSLRETRGGPGNHEEPYRMYNSDVFQYNLDSPMTLYGTIPLMQAHRKDSTVGVFWLNGAETWVDIVKEESSPNPLSLGVGAKTTTQTHWISESGQLDVFVLLGPTPEKISKDFGQLTGNTQLPQHFALGYHQCRWNYATDEDVRDVDRKFDMYQIPYDVIWLDVDYTDGKRYFTWDPYTFAHPEGMQRQLDESDRRLVVIIDPHIKNDDDYPVDQELKKKDLGTRNKNGDLFEAHCWPGSSHYIDCFNPEAAKWLKGLYSYDRFKGTLENSFIWNDMNEPSVFNGPEMTMPKDNIHYGNWEHRDIHNIHGMTFVNATYNALLGRKKGEHRRPFVLTRSFFPGTQRIAAMWTGDNQAKWDHLAISLPMILNNGISGFPFAGADVGGFMETPSSELFTRWYQAGIWYPFMRAHSHIETKRREPYMIGDPYTPIISQALRLRYQLLPAWYTAFHEASVNGTPIVRPQYYVHPADENGFAIDDQLYLGSTGLLVKPVVTEGATSTDVYLADDEKYYDYFDFTIYQGAGERHTVPAPLEKVPLLMQGGHVFPRKDRPRRSSGLMKWDPYTLVVVPDKNGKAQGTLYVDDGESFDYTNGAYIHRQFILQGTTLSSENLAAAKGAKTTTYLKSMDDVKVHKVVIISPPKEWQGKASVLVTEEGTRTTRSTPLEYFEQEKGKASYVVLKNPNVGIGKSWTLEV